MFYLNGVRGLVPVAYDVVLLTQAVFPLETMLFAILSCTI
jgi:hypothetical protein